jgi:predicted GNAT family acetyltransferase
MVDGQLAIAAYARSGKTITFTHTEVPAALRGRRVGDALAHTALETAREQGWTVVARCPFIKAYIARHPEYEELLHVRR